MISFFGRFEFLGYALCSLDQLVAPLVWIQWLPWEPIFFGAVGYGTHQYLEEATKFTENSVKNGQIGTFPLLTS